MTKKYLPAFICGFGAAVLNTVPALKIFSCCLLVPAASIIAIYLYKKSHSIEGDIPTSRGLVFGLVTGLAAAIFAAFFDILITYITHSNELVESFPQTESMLRNMNLSFIDESMKLFNNMVVDIKTNGFSFLYAAAIVFSNVITYTVFGMIGGVIGTFFINKKTGRH